MVPAPGNITQRPVRRGHLADDPLAALLEINRQLALASALDQVPPRIVEAAGRLLEVEAAGLRLVEGNELVRAASFGAGGAIMARERLPIGESLSGRVVAEGRSIVSSDLCEDPRYDPTHRIQARAQGFRAWLGVPLRGRDRIVGVLFVVTGETRQFALAEVELLEAFADQAALAVENARLVAASERRAAEATALAEVGRALSGSLDLRAVLGLIVDHACQLAAAQRAALALVVSDGDRSTIQFVARRGMSDAFRERMRPRHWRDGTTALAIAERRAVSSTDILADPTVELTPGTRAAVEHEGYRAELSVPLLTATRVLGALVVYRDEAGPFGTQEVDLLRAFADQAAIALQNARAFQQEQERRRQLEAVRDVAAEMTRELDLGRLLSLITRRATELVQAASGVVCLYDEATQLLLPRAWHGVGTEGWVAEAPWKLGVGAMGTAAERRQGMIVNDYRTSPYALPDILERSEITALLTEPILVQDRLVGVIAVAQTDVRRSFDEGDRELLKLFADQAAIAVENARLYAAAEQLSLTDTLTGVPNRRHFDRALAEEVARADRHGEPLTLLLADIDHFKAYNDTRGHQAGDEVLRAVAHLLGQSARSTDVVARYGGEEFAILLPNTDAAGARAASEKVRRAVAAAGLGLTISIGGAVRPAADHGEPADPAASRLIAAADAALYDAKRAGRDRAVIA